MKKILTILSILCICLSLSACNNQNGVKNDTVKVTLYEDDYLNLFDENYVEKILNASSDVDNAILSLAGSKIPDYTFKDLEGNDINLVDGPYVFEVVGSWCGYCQALSSRVLEDLITKYPDVKFYQYFLMGEKGDVDVFYETIEKDIPENLTVLLAEDETIDNWLYDQGFDSIPLVITVDKNNTISLSRTGYESYNYFVKLIDFALNEEIGKYVLSNGQTYSSFIQEQQAARRYLREIKEVDVPKEYLD